MSNGSTASLGIAGSLARRFLTTEITPLLALLGLLMGVFAVMVTPREEEPQIDVTFANIFIPYPGATASEVAQLVSTPAEQVLSEIAGIKHVYSQSRPGMSQLTVRFKVGEPRTEAIVRLYNKVFSNEDWLPRDLGVLDPIIKPKGIDDVPILTATLWSEQDQWGGHELLRISHALETELKRVSGTRNVYTRGGPDRVVHVTLDPTRIAGYGIALGDLRRSLRAANASRDAGVMVDNNLEIPVQAGTFLQTPQEVSDLVIAMHDGEPVFLRDVATIGRGPDSPEDYVVFGTGPAASSKGIEGAGAYPAVTLAIAKKPGTNAVKIAEDLIQRLEQLEGVFIPEGVNITITRNYGMTADAKAKTLIKKLFFATSVVVLLVLVALGWREAVIVGTAVVITLAIMLFASWAWGFTLNRVSLFALIFSIGILVDDAIVVVENIHRHLEMGARDLTTAIPPAVDEVGGPTILATFTVIAALLPMAFVTGLMGPYMSPIPINASIGMLVSLVVAFVITPWLSRQLLGAHVGAHGEHDGNQPAKESRLLRFFRGLLGPFLSSATSRLFLGLVMLGLIGASLALPMVNAVVLKMLPFDDKSEFQVIVDMPEGTSLERTHRVLSELSDYIATVPEVTDYQTYAGTAAPINFNGLVRQYYLRQGSHVGDIQVNLVDKHDRDRRSHEIAKAVRDPLQAIGAQHDANVKIVEVPPGPPVQSPIVAEIYGLDYAGQIEVAKDIRQIFAETDGVVDIDDSVEALSSRLIVHVDRQRATMLGVSQSTVAAAVATVLKGEDMGYLHGDTMKYPVPIRVEYPVADKADLEQLLALKLRSDSGALVPLSEIAHVEFTTREKTIYHKDLLPVVFVTADMAGATDSPLYGMFRIFGRLSEEALGFGGTVQQTLIQQPENPYEYSVKWHGEWQVTYETFRDMGIAYSVGLLLIYFLVVAQFRSYVVPLIIMAPIPLTLIGVLPGHALLGAKFTATSMIGMIALAGIIVRNSILLVDFVNDSVRQGTEFKEAVIQSGAVRAKPIVLTGLAAMLGAFFILDDPIFSGLAISLIFGVFVSTLLTLIVIPVLYYAYMHKRLHQIPA